MWPQSSGEGGLCVWRFKVLGYTDQLLPFFRIWRGKAAGAPLDAGQRVRGALYCCYPAVCPTFGFEGENNLLHHTAPKILCGP